MSLTPQVFNVHRTPTFDESIQRLEKRTYYPFVKSFMNNDIVEISINQGDAWILMYDAAIFIKGRINKKTGAGKCNFANNGAAFLFDSVTYELNGKEIETVRNPGITSAIRAYLCYAPKHEKFLVTSSWNGPNKSFDLNNDGTFSIRLPLNHLFGIFNDYKLATCGKQTLRLVRARNDNNALLLEPDEGAALTAEIQISNIELKVKHIQPNDLIRLDLLKSIQIDRPIIIAFRKWELHELPSLTFNAQREIWSVKSSASVSSPRFVIVGFQCDRVEDDKKDPSVFDHIDTNDVRLVLNGEYFPFERQRLNFNANDYLEAYHNYVDFYPSYMNTKDSQPMLSYKEYKEHAALFVVDCSRRGESMKTGTVDVKLDIESSRGFPERTRAYCIIIHDCTMEYLPLSEVVRSLM